MASSRDNPKGWSTRAGSSPPSAADDVDSTSPLLDPVAHALSEPEPPGAPGYGSPLSDSEEEMVFAPPPRRPRPAPGPRRRRAKPVRRVKRTLRHVDPFSVLKVSLLFYGVFLIIWLVVVAILYWIVDAAGLFDLIDNVRAAAAFEGKFEVTLTLVEKWAFFLGVIVAIVASLFNLFLAFLYNVVADIVGGIDVTFVERDL
ncbi:MAG: DUF3566 domain-containing protein [Actinomycetota bacterium]|nr:DUF3566 domain-containing protein [Actinomycetota bacterium]